MTIQPNPIDILPELRSLRDGEPFLSGARSTLERAIAELLALRDTATAAQNSASALRKENRDLKAIVAGHPVVRIMRVGEHDLPLPRYETDGAAGMDLRADVSGMQRLALGVVRAPPSGDRPWLLTIYPGARALIPCGFAFEIPPGFEGQVRGRSGWTDRGLYVATGTVDSDFRGAAGIHVANRSAGPIEIEHGARIAQLVIGPAPQARIEEALELSPSARGTGGFGSTGDR